MATITLKINEKSKTGKIFMAVLKQFISENDKAVELLDIPNKETLRAIENIETGKGITRTKSHLDLMRKLNS